MNRDLCIECSKPVADHFGPDREWVGCVPLTPITVTIGDGPAVRLTTKREVYHFLARLKQQAA